MNGKVTATTIIIIIIIIVVVVIIINYLHSAQVFPKSLEWLT
jgi:hypothetical protein